MPSPNKHFVSHSQVERLAQVTAQEIDNVCARPRLYPIPRGGIPAAYAVAKYLPNAFVVDTPELATHFIDDLIDSGATLEKWFLSHPRIPFKALLDKRTSDEKPWYVFPWEIDEDRSKDDSIIGTITNRFREKKIPFLGNDNVAEHLLDGEMTLVQEEVARRMQRVLGALLIDVENDHNTQGTAKRVAKMFCREIYRGRFEAPPRITDFPNIKNLDELYMTGPITVRSSCSHHMCPILGKAWVGIIPGERVIGLSKFNRLIDWVCSRPQIQEEMVVQVADVLENLTEPKGLAVIIEASHTCMTWRGVKEEDSARMTTSVMRGAFRDKPEARAEFMALVNKG